jgi:phosphoribosylformylglycinamidine cyclo-ligase
VKGVVHVTGGGLTENMPRVLPGGVDATIDMTGWHPPNIFKIIQDMGKIDEVEMFKTFNMGIGMVVIVDVGDFRQAISVLNLANYRAARIGEMREGTGGICITC